MDLSGKSCRNPDFRSEGPYCYISTEIEQSQSEPAWIQCAVPNFAMKDQQICQVVTESGALIGRTSDSHVLQSNHGSFEDSQRNIQIGFAEFWGNFITKQW